jgi:hypothetical protein
MLLFVLSGPAGPGRGGASAVANMERRSASAIMNGSTAWTRGGIKLAQFCGDFIRGPRTNVMIRHPIRAALRISVSAICASSLADLRKPRASGAELRLDVVARGIGELRGTSSGSRAICPIDARRFDSGPPASRINPLVTKP